MTIETEVSFASPADLKAFSDELAGEIARLSVKYNKDHSPQGRRFRIVIGSHPVITKTDEEAQAEVIQHQKAKGKRKSSKPS